MRVYLMLAALFVCTTACMASTQQAPGYWLGDAFWANLYETANGTANGAPSETPPPFALPGQVTVTEGYVVLLEGSPNDTSIANWSDILVFSRTTVQLVSERDLPGALPFDPTLVQNVQGGNTVYWSETNMPTIYIAGDATYNIYSDHEIPDTPEPSGILTLPLGMITLGTALRRKMGRARG